MANKLMFVPIICFILFPTTFIITFSIALSYDHINPFFSYVSDTGATSPELCWFALLLSLTSISLGFVMYIRYMQVAEYFRQEKNRTMRLINVIAIVIGMISALGGMIVAAFQETNILSMHVLGAFLSFLGGAIYMIFQAFFTFKMLPMFVNKTIAVIRLIIGISCVILFAISYITAAKSLAKFKGDNFLKWDRDEETWNLRAVSVTAEWVMAALFDVYLLTFVLDFRKISYKSPQVELLRSV